MSLSFHGSVFSGLGRGAYYVGHPGFRIRFEKLLGYAPYPGTLNVRLADAREVGQRMSLRSMEGYSIERFTHGDEHLSAVKCFEGSLLGTGVVLTIPEITEYDDSVLELIAPVRLRDLLGLVDGQRVDVSLKADLLLGINRDGDRAAVLQP